MAWWWHQSTFRSVITTQGRVLQVLYPGRPSAGAGPDFRDALLITKYGDFVRGDLEVHIRQRDWQSHGHHQDSRYNSVVLHVFLQGGRHGQGGGNGSWLDEAGERRFMCKASAMLERLRRGDAQEELYAGLMEALGYSRNRDTMSQLAMGLPIRQLKRLVGSKPDPLALEAPLLGAAGLLPHQRGICLPGWEERKRTGALVEIWQSTGEPLLVTTGMWNRTGIRPQNHQVRRLVGASYLIGEYWHSGLVEGLRTIFENEAPREIEKSLEVESTEFWDHHLDFHLPVARAPALVGRSRAREKVINVLLPFFFARGHLLGDRELGEKALTLYRSFPPAQDNEITREMKALLLASKVGRLVVNSARRQQGLIHMYHVLQGLAM